MLAAIHCMTVIEVKGFGRQERPHFEGYRGSEHVRVPAEVLKMAVVVTEEQLESAVSAITKAARTGKIGDGKIFVSSLDDVIRIRPAEKGMSAI